MRLALAALALGLRSTLAAAAPAAGAPQVQPVMANQPVFIVRHMQKGEGPDPSLTAQGAANAQQLAAVLSGKGIVAIFATPTLRAMETGAPLAKALGIAVTAYDPAQTALLAAKVAAAGGPVLIVGHSNTVPDLVQLFGGTRPAPLTDGDYGAIYDVEPGGAVVIAQLR